MDNLREWISDNLRYILLGLAVILLVIIAFFAVRLVRGIGSPKQAEVTTAEDAANTDEQAAAVEESETEAKENALELLDEDSDLYKLIKSYYDAVAAKDYDTLAQICESFTDEDQATVEQESAIEAYNNLKVYAKEGPEEGTYVVYPYFDAKITGIDTAMPCLREIYVVTGDDGTLLIGSKSSSKTVEDYVNERTADHDVQALVKDVNDLADAAMDADADLAAYVDSLSDDSDSGTGDDSNSDSSTTASGETMMATTGINVRADASTESDIRGALYQGMTVTVLETLDSGWSHITYDSDGTTIEGYVMTQYLEAAG